MRVQLRCLLLLIFSYIRKAGRFAHEQQCTVAQKCLKAGQLSKYTSKLSFLQPSCGNSLYVTDLLIIVVGKYLQITLKPPLLSLKKKCNTVRTLIALERFGPFALSTITLVRASYNILFMFSINKLDKFHNQGHHKWGKNKIPMEQIKGSIKYSFRQKLKQLLPSNDSI